MWKCRAGERVTGCWRGRAAFVRLLGSQVEELRRGSAEYTTTGQIVTPGDKADPNDKLPITVPNEQEEVPKKKSSCCVVS